MTPNTVIPQAQVRLVASQWLRWLFPKPSVFISYAHEVVELALALMQRLEKAGFDVYLDEEKTLAGEQFLAVIVQHLLRCDAVLTLAVGTACIRCDHCSRFIGVELALGLLDGISRGARSDRSRFQKR
jgi:TIR domain